MLTLYVLPLVAQVIVPLALLAWLWFARSRNRASMMLPLFTTAAYLVAIALAASG